MTVDLVFQGRSVLVTGGASGIGEGTARRLASLGADVVIGDIDRDGGARVADDIGAAFVHLDVADTEAWDRVVARHGPFDVAFLNAGVSTGGDRQPGELPVVDMADAAYRRIMSINVDGVVFGTRAVLPAMIEAGRGDIVVTASMAGIGPIAVDPVYGATKHAVVGFVRSMHAALEPHAADICISSVCPGFADTNILNDGAKAMISEIGLPLLTPAEVADVVVRALTERVGGAQWVVWPDMPVAPYEWTPAIPPIGELAGTRP